MIEKSKNNLPKIGYLYHFPNPDHPSEKFRLEIFISTLPTEHHFDVLKAHFLVKTPQGFVADLPVTHPWAFERNARVCAGVVVMEDRKGKKEEAFTFGGQLNIERQESQTVCDLVSTAPIIEISGATPLHQFFIDEIEILLAEHRARYPNHQAYEKRVCQIDPFSLYTACLVELIARLEGFQHKDESYKQLLAYLYTQEHRAAAAGLIEDAIPTLENLLE